MRKLYRRVFKRRSGPFGFTLVELLMTLGVAAFLICSCGYFMRGCLVDSQRAVDAATNDGFTDVSVVSHQYVLVGWRGCSGDTDAAKFVMRGKRGGRDVKFFVCSGLLKGSTIRFD